MLAFSLLFTQQFFESGDNKICSDNLLNDLNGCGCGVLDQIIEIVQIICKIHLVIGEMLSRQVWVCQF